jgi:hypothetical protein
MGDWFFNTAMGVIGDCRQPAPITVGNRRQPLWKIFFRGGKAFSTFRRRQRLDQPQENFPPSSFLEICETPNLSTKSNSVAQVLLLTQRQR